MASDLLIELSVACDAEEELLYGACDEEGAGCELGGCVSGDDDEGGVCASRHPEATSESAAKAAASRCVFMCAPMRLGSSTA